MKHLAQNSWVAARPGCQKRGQKKRERHHACAGAVDTKASRRSSFVSTARHPDKVSATCAKLAAGA